MAEVIGPRLYSCCNCRNHVALHDDVISKAFQVISLNWFSLSYAFVLNLF
uniref:Protein yippee-like At4g27745 n=1 Tax=Rhizophora mucronata TaxID=61149 RepID=A0A2P2LTU3_RHIMU